MGTDQIQRERELFEQNIKGRAPGANLQRIGDEYIDRDVQLHFETWLACAGSPREAASDQDRDRDRRAEVAAALGLMRNADFSWAFLLQKIREYTKASGREYALPFRLQR